MKNGARQKQSKLSTVDMTDELLTQIKMIYGWDGDTEIRLICQSENTTYLVENTITHFKGVLRIGKYGYHAKEELQSELDWMAHLRQTTSLNIPCPLPAPNGEYIQLLSHPVLKKTYNCLLFSFVAGDSPENAPRRELIKHFATLGEVTALLHKNVIEWDKAPANIRFTWDYNDMVGERARLGSWQHADDLTYEGEHILEETCALIQERLIRFGKDKSRFGLIHSDLRLANLLLDQGQIAVIDFDDAGFGWFWHDFGSAFSFIENEPYVPSLTAAWKEGYRRIRDFSAAEEAELTTFIMIRRLLLMGWIATHQDSNVVKGGIDIGHTAGTVDLAKKYLHTMRF